MAPMYRDLLEQALHHLCEAATLIDATGNDELRRRVLPRLDGEAGGAAQRNSIADHVKRAIADTDDLPA